MDETVLKIAIAAFMHDIGRLVERDALNVPDELLRELADAYDLKENEDDWSAHASLTAAFFKDMKELLPAQLTSAEWGEGNNCVDLAASHHKPETPMQWLVAVADRLSYGCTLNRQPAKTTNQDSGVDYYHSTLVPILEDLAVGGRTGAERGRHSYSYALAPLSADSVFPVQAPKTSDGTTGPSREEHRSLYQKFTRQMGYLFHGDDNLELWFEHFDSLVMCVFANVAAGQEGLSIPMQDISLYDHLRTCSALATALYLYHRDTATLDVDAVKEYSQKKFLLLNGDFYGIQDFIFSTHGATRKYRSKLLRGRSFAVSVFSELAADMICRALGVTNSSVVLNAAGKFVIIAPNTERALDAIKSAQTRINNWLVGVSYGENSLGLSLVEASPGDLVSGSFPVLWESLQREAERKKFNRLDLNEHGGEQESYLNSFVNDLHSPICPLCGKRPSSPQAEGSDYVKDAVSSCDICRDHVYLGANLVKKDRVLVMLDDSAEAEAGNRLFEPILGKYQMSFVAGGSRSDLVSRNGKLCKVWDISFDLEHPETATGTARFLNGYVPVFSEEDRNDQRLLSGRGSEARQRELIQQINLGDPKTLGHIANKALNYAVEGSALSGVEALGILKADVDHLGLLMACGLPEEMFNVSRLSTLSRQLHLYFSLHLPHLLRSDDRFADVYTVFAGGDDLFVVGPWNRMRDLATVLRDSFARYVCQNPSVHFSAGIVFVKAHTPIDRMAASAEMALLQSKDLGRNRVTVFGETGTWTELEELDHVRETLDQWLRDDWIDSAMLYRLNELLEMAAREGKLAHQSEIKVSDMECTKWRAYLAYSVERNVGKAMKAEKRTEVIRRVQNSSAEWLTKYGGRLKIPLWEVLYNRR